MTNNIAKIRVALELANRGGKLYAMNGLRQKTSEALAALAELEKSTAPQFVAGVVTDDVAARVLTHFSNFPVRLSNAQNGHDMIAAVRSELGPALGLVELKEPTPEECADMAEWFKSECAACCINPQESADYGRAIFDAVKIVLWPKSEAK